MNVLEKFAEKVSDTGSASQDRLEKMCREWYNRYLKAHASQYIIGTPMSFLMFLSLPYRNTKALELEPGTLVRIGNDQESGKYCIIYKMGMSGDTVIVYGRDSEGKEHTMGPDDYSKADIPQEIINVVKESILKDVKCPIADACKRENHEAV